MYKLRPEEFKSEKDVAKLIKYLEESPLNKQPLPDAGSASQSDESRRGKDLLERLMEKGLMPLAALDVIRGWMVLEKWLSPPKMIEG